MWQWKNVLKRHHLTWIRGKSLSCSKICCLCSENFYQGKRKRKIVIKKLSAESLLWQEVGRKIISSTKSQADMSPGQNRMCGNKLHQAGEKRRFLRAGHILVVPRLNLLLDGAQIYWRAFLCSQNLSAMGTRVRCIAWSLHQSRHTSLL